jgi:cell division protein FtsB
VESSDSRFLRIERHLGFWSRPTKILFAAVLAVCLFGVVLGEYGFVRIIELRKERARLEEEITLAKKRGVLLEARKHELETDDFAIEEIARLRGGMYKPGEIIFLFEYEDSTQDADYDRISLDNYSLNR